jgi:hypothetical protein
MLYSIKGKLYKLRRYPIEKPEGIYKFFSHYESSCRIITLSIPTYDSISNRIFMFLGFDFSYLTKYHWAKLLHLRTGTIVYYNEPYFEMEFSLEKCDKDFEKTFQKAED